MDFTLNNFDFKVNLLEDTASIDKLLEEYNLQIKGYEVKLSNRELQLEKAENRSEDLDEDIQTLTAEIAAKETELTNHAEGTRKHEEIAIDLDALKVRLRKLNLRKGDTTSPAIVVERNADTGESQLLLAYYTQLKEALEARKGELYRT